MSITQLPEQLAGGVAQLAEMLGAPPPTTWSISGTITVAGVPLAGVTVTTGAASATTGLAGTYVIDGLPAGSYTIAASAVGYSFAPPTRSVTITSANVTGQDFAGTESSIVPDPRPISPAADILAIRLLAVIEGEGEAAVEVWPEVWYSDLGITTDVTDTPSATVIEDRLIGEVRYRARVVPLIWGRGEGAAPVGQITLANGDGALDPIVGAGWTGRIGEIYRGDRDLPVSDWTLLVRTRVAEPPTAPDEESVVIALGSIADRLDQPIQTEVFADDLPAEALRGQQRPFGIGYCYSVPALLVDPPNLRYELHDGTGITIDRVRAAGNILDPLTEWTATGAGFELDTNPFGARVVADVLFGADSEPQTVIGDLLARAGIESADVDWDTLTWSADIGVWAGSPSTGAELLAYALDSYAAGWYVDRLDRIAFWGIDTTLPAVPARTITEDDLTDTQISVSADTAPGYVDVIAGGRNWHVHAPNELAGALIDPTVTQAAIDLQADYRFRRRGDETAPVPPTDPGDGYVTRPGGGSPRKPAEAQGNGIGTALVAATDVAAEAVRLRAIFGGDVIHWFVSFEITVDLLDLWFGQWLLLNLPRYEIYGDAAIVGIDADLATGATVLTCWLPASTSRS